MNREILFSDLKPILTIKNKHDYFEIRHLNIFLNIVLLVFLLLSSWFLVILLVFDNFRHLFGTLLLLIVLILPAVLGFTYTLFFGKVIFKSNKVVFYSLKKFNGIKSEVAYPEIEKFQLDYKKKSKHSEWKYLYYIVICLKDGKKKEIVSLGELSNDEIKTMNGFISYLNYSYCISNHEGLLPFS